MDLARHSSGARGLPRERLRQGRQHRQQPPPTRVDHTGTLQHGQLAGGRHEGRPCSLVGRARDRAAVALRAGGRLGGGRGDREDRALHGVRDGLACGVCGLSQGQPEGLSVGVSALTIGRTVGLTTGRTVDLTVGGEDLRHAAQQLREDRPGVPAGPDQRPVRHRPHGVGERGQTSPRDLRGNRPGGSGPCGAEDPRHGLVARENRLHRRCRRLHRQIQIRPGVPVRDRVDIDGVDLLARPPQRLQREAAPGAHRESIQCLRHLRHLRLLEHLDVARSVVPEWVTGGRGPQGGPG